MPKPTQQVLVGSLAVLWLVLSISPALCQDSNSQAIHLSISQLKEDLDGDYVPDRLGGRFLVEGYATMEPRRPPPAFGLVMMEPRRSPPIGRGDWLVTTIEDGTAGVRLLARGSAALVDVHVGSWVAATGILVHRGGSEILVVDDIEVSQRNSEVQPTPALVSDVSSETFMHRLVELQGNLRDYDAFKTQAVLEDRSGSVPVWITPRMMMDPDFASHVRDGGFVTLVGIVGQADRTPPYDSAYWVAPRDPDDFSWASTFPMVEVLAVLLILSVVAGIISFAYQRGALRRARKLEILSDDLRQSQQDLKASSAEYKALFEDDAVARFVLDSNRKFKRWNRAFELFLQRRSDEILGKSVHEILPDVAQSSPTEIAEGYPEQVEVRVTVADGKSNVGLLTLASSAEKQQPGLRGSIVDVTKRKELEIKLVNTQKMQAVGRLGGGIAHDVNNMLSVILGNTDLVLSNGPFDRNVSDRLEEIRVAAERSARLTRQLLTIARRDVAQREVLGINDVIREMMPVLQREAGIDVELVVCLAEDLPDVYAALPQIEQVLLNLMANAREAMPDGGSVSLETAQILGENRQTDQVSLVLADNGMGMDADILDRAFEPFFSTKENGNGLGLSTVYGIVTQIGGTISCQSEPMQGTTFKILLPATTEPRAESTPPVEIKTEEKLAHTVLLAEDDQSVRYIVRGVLEKEGCTVIEAINGEDALRTFEKDPSLFDVVVTDIVMPIIGGWELGKRLNALRPDLPIVFMSGYVENAEARRKLREGTDVFIQKPFRTTALAEALKTALASRRSAPKKK